MTTLRVKYVPKLHDLAGSDELDFPGMMSLTFVDDQDGPAYIYEFISESDRNWAKAEVIRLLGPEAITN